MAQPRLGTVVDGPTTTASITFAGVHERPSYEIGIQIMVDGDRWITIASAVTSELPSSTDPTVHEWNVIAAPAQLSPSRWRQGGLLRVRALGADGEVLAGLFHDADACLDETPDWRGRAEFCGAEFPSGIIIVSPADVANSVTRPRFLDRRGWIDGLETDRYYQTIGAPATLTEFRTRFAIDAVATSTYYNASDLGIGRAMSCTPQPGGGVACAVTNYGEFGGQARDALDRAIDDRGGFVTVAMVYQPPITAPNSVQFMVYGASGALSNIAQLDTVGDNQAVPNNCINCHGSTATYDPVTHQVSSASFLPFDPNTFVFSPRAGYTERDQVPKLAVLNDAVRVATSVSNRELIDGWYPYGTDQPAQDFVPVTWAASPLERQVYRHVIADTCRTCHASRADELGFATAETFVAKAAEITRSICTLRDMPNAQVPLQRMWSGPARAYLAAYLDIDACDP